jgi:hypothetical protein
MDWLNMLKADQEAAPDTITSFSILPPDALSKLSKVTAPEQVDIFAPDYQNDSTPANNGKDKPLYCFTGDCWCSQKLPGNDCGACEYLTTPRQPPPATETEPATFEQTGDPVSCKYWFQVCWACKLYFEQCTRNTECKIYRFLTVNS